MVSGAEWRKRLQEQMEKALKESEILEEQKW